MAKCNPKVHIGRCLERIDGFLSSYVGGTNSMAWKDKLKVWLLPEMQRLMEKHGMYTGTQSQLAGEGGGAMVNAPGNGNQSALYAKNPQCDPSGKSQLPPPCAGAAAAGLDRK